MADTVGYAPTRPAGPARDGCGFHGSMLSAPTATPPPPPAGPASDDYGFHGSVLFLALASNESGWVQAHNAANGSVVWSSDVQGTRFSQLAIDVPRVQLLVTDEKAGEVGRERARARACGGGGQG